MLIDLYSLFHVFLVICFLSDDIIPAYCQERFSNMFSKSLQHLTDKVRLLYPNSKEWSILDVGANEGGWSDMMRKNFFPSASYFLIEGNNKYNSTLKMKSYDYTISLVGDKKKAGKFQYNKRYPTGGTILQEVGLNKSPGFREVESNITTIDNILATNHVKPPQLMKMDIQGAEFMALRGAIETLRSVEVLVIEVSLHQYNIGAASFGDINIFLESQGFRFFDVADFRHASLVYRKAKKEKILLQVDIIWAKASSPLFTATFFPEPPPSLYKCQYTGN